MSERQNDNATTRRDHSDDGATNRPSHDNGEKEGSSPKKGLTAKKAIWIIGKMLSNCRRKTRKHILVRNRPEAGLVGIALSIIGPVLVKRHVHSDQPPPHQHHNHNQNQHPLLITPRSLGLSRRVLDALRARNESLAVAESLTGGLLSASLTHHAGASAAIRGAVVAYTNPVKRALLAVPAAVLDGPGPVSAKCASAMAAGVRDALEADWGVATTGFAGGSGGGGSGGGGAAGGGGVGVGAAGSGRGGDGVSTPDRDGLVFLHVAGPGPRNGEGDVVVDGGEHADPSRHGRRGRPVGGGRRCEFDGQSRAGNRAAAVEAALEMLLEFIEEDEVDDEVVLLGKDATV
ncbi:competence-damaged protein-domain-containing protein [Zopfochytrium polystomum]|nr:competence-damaged protein-domain-containing protein [Zopfochytrium polystomum]